MARDRRNQSVFCILRLFLGGVDDIEQIRIQYNVPAEAAYVSDEVDAVRLLSARRLDIAAKVLFLDLWEHCPKYAEKIYLEHVRAMTKGSFVEPYSSKNSPESFVSSFLSLYESIKKEGYRENAGPVPVDRNFRPMGGAHRIAICMKLGIRVPVAILPVDAEYDIYDQKYFERQGMDEDVLDQIVRKYVSLSPRCICINIWPSAKGHDGEMDDIIAQEFDVFYRKSVAFNETGAYYYLAQIYEEYSWAQKSDNGFSGVYRKLMPCFPTFNPVRTVFADVDDYEKLPFVKERMRRLFNLEKHSLHITDNKDETVQMADIILSNNTIGFLNRCQALQFKNTFSLLEKAKTLSDRGDTVFAGSIVMALYGVRKAEDLDYICREDDAESHNAYVGLYEHTKEELLCRSDLSFSFFGLRFLTLACIENFKKNRGERKDQEDIKLIDMVRRGDGDNWKVAYIRKKRRVIAGIQGAIIRLSHITGTYELMRNIYKKLK